jgi:hypothetical protein
MRKNQFGQKQSDQKIATRFSGPTVFRFWGNLEKKKKTCREKGDNRKNQKAKICLIYNRARDET